jgi:hypothetical protein
MFYPVPSPPRGACSAPKKPSPSFTEPPFYSFCCPIFTLHTHTPLVSQALSLVTDAGLGDLIRDIVEAETDYQVVGDVTILCVIAVESRADPAPPTKYTTRTKATALLALLALVAIPGICIGGIFGMLLARRKKEEKEDNADRRHA